MAYRLDGPNGLPREGRWYAYKVSRNWGGGGLRDFIVSFDAGGTPAGRLPGHRRRKTPACLRQDQTLTFIGVDAQYFSAVLMPAGRSRPTISIESMPLRVGNVDPHAEEHHQHLVAADQQDARA